MAAGRLRGGRPQVTRVMVIACKRRFRQLVAWGILLVTVSGGAPPAWAGENATVLIRIQQVPLAGFQYHAGKVLWDRMAEGDALTLTREPDNRHDSQAVRVSWQGVQLGYLPRSDNAAVAAAMDQGWQVTARIGRLVPHPDPWRRVRVDVFAAPP
jgi:HIRAN domain-containing protein